MRKTETGKQKLVYGLDIGTRSVVGTVGYLEKDRFVVVAQRIKEHETRAMIDGQIHDIGAVGETIREITDQLELDIKEELKQVCIAAAGRVLRTVTTHVDIDFEGEKLITKEDIFALDSYGVEKAYEEFQETNNTGMKFYCVGYTVMRYFMNDYPMGQLENHKAKTIAADLIATFLPDDVVDGLYKAVELAGLEVANVTLEPIAAMEVAIPQMYRMLNIALIDVGAGTSDISITKDGSIVAYGMLPIAGDCMTEDIARHCLVDFTTAETIKRGIEKSDEVEYKDIMGISQKISKEEVLSVVADHLTSMADQAADKIMEMNGDKPVSAVFVVGGGGKIEGYTAQVAKRLGIAQERCALRGEEVMQKIDFLPNHVVKDSTLVTPIGICLNFYEQSNNFMFVTFNGQRVKLYDNNKLAIIDAAMQAEFRNEDLFPKRGEELVFTFNGKQRTIRGQRGESAEIFLNGTPADIHSPIRANDVITVNPSTAGEMAKMELGKMAEYQEQITVVVNGMTLTLPKFASVNGNLESPYYEIQSNDDISMLGFYTVEQITEVMDVILDKNMQIMVNHQAADMETKVYDNFTVEWSLAKADMHTVKSDEQEDWEDTVEEIRMTQDGIDEDIQVAHDETATDMQQNQTETATDVRALRDETVADTQEKTAELPPVKPGSMLEKAIASAQKIAQQPVTAEVEEEFKKARAYAAAERISAFATAFNQTGQMPQQPKQPAFRPFQPGNSGFSLAGKEKSANVEKDRPLQQEKKPEPAATVKDTDDSTVTVTVNGEQVVLSGKSDYIYVDVFDHIDFDLSKPQGKTVETLINGRQAQYVEPLTTGDVLEIFWKE